MRPGEAGSLLEERRATLEELDVRAEATEWAPD